ncbi:MAG: hypothetical protein ACREQ5_11505 [Candidatus Dormibacteria bacterium]
MAVTPEVMQHIIDRGVALSRAAHVMVTSELVWRSIQNRIAADTWDRLYGKLFRGQQAAHRRRGAR